MKEEFYECSAGPQNAKTQKTIYTIYNVLFILSVVAAVVFIYFFLMVGDIPFIILFVMATLFAVGCYFIRRRIYAFFDYTYISGEVRIIKVINGKSRRRFCVLDCKSIDQVGNCQSNSFEKLYNTPGYKHKIATPNGLGSDNPLYYIAGTFEGEKQVVVLECDEKLLAFIVSYCGRKVLEEDFVSAEKKTSDSENK